MTKFLQHTPFLPSLPHKTRCRHAFSAATRRGRRRQHAALAHLRITEHGSATCSNMQLPSNDIPLDRVVGIEVLEVGTKAVPAFEEFDGGLSVAFRALQG